MIAEQPPQNTLEQRNVYHLRTEKKRNDPRGELRVNFLGINGSHELEFVHGYSANPNGKDMTLITTPREYTMNATVSNGNRIIVPDNTTFTRVSQSEQPDRYELIRRQLQGAKE